MQRFGRSGEPKQVQRMVMSTYLGNLETLSYIWVCVDLDLEQDIEWEVW